MSTSTTHQQSLVDAGSETRPLMLEKEDLKGDDLKHYEAEIEPMNLILISVLNDIYNSVDACSTAQAMWQRVERLMRGTVQNKIDTETRFNNEFNQFIAELGEALVLVYNRFAQLMNDLERNGIIFPKVTVNTKFLNCLQPEWLKYVTQVRLAKRLTEDTYDDLNQAIVQADRVQIQSRNSGNDGINTKCSYVQEEVIEGTNVQNDAENTQRTLRTTSSGTAMFNATTAVRKNDFLFADASRIEEIEELNANICLMARIQPTNFDSDEGPSYDSGFLSEVQTPSTSYVNPLFAKDKQKQKYPKQPKIINNTIGDDQINSNIIFDEPNEDVNSDSVEYDNNVQESYELEQLARNAFKEAEKTTNNC
ncbi:hypothetical protein Tco_1404610 [Tanacetum coccineum]